jgi:hypothetical protein
LTDFTIAIDTVCVREQTIFVAVPKERENDIMIYKITVLKTVFVEAENEEEAKEVMFDEDEIMIDERITDIKESSQKELRQMLLGE